MMSNRAHCIMMHRWWLHRRQSMRVIETENESVVRRRRVPPTAPHVLHPNAMVLVGLQK